ncbi:hypothetical protein C1H76_6885 [Elsinoe australis]|uniref:Small ribosomal subunit protein mS35 mitochondrial conserved domain-containing protein n=1 Tax=Elsinoe australis TaxID=40998 RepID=A0A4U7AS78_9PEZI|nr:hypothetical protein C1H76_6885 [Elsinoe australis]
MAAPASSLYRQAARISHRTQWLSYRQWQSTSQRQQSFLRPFSSTPLRPAEESNTNPASNDDIPHFNDTFFASLSAAEKTAYLQSSPAERRDQEEMHALLNSELGPNSKAGRDLEALVERYVNETKEDLGPDFGEKAGRLPRVPEDFSTMADPDPEIAPDEEFQDDDISSHAHAELDQHREMREYMRLASWEMPLLSTLSLPFEPPTSAQPLRWRYTTYLGTPHPASNKVVLTFSPSALPDLTPQQTSKLIKLAGPRYNPHTDTVKMSCESFPSQAQNKRYLGDTLSKLLSEAKDSKEKFDDVPYDFRHARENKRLRFPKEWRVTGERKAELEGKREERERLQRERKEKLGGELVDGIRSIEEGRYRLANEVQKELGGAQQPAGRAAQGVAVRGRGR